MKGSKLLRELMLKHFIGYDDLYNSRFKEHVPLRVAIMKDLEAAGLNVSEIARLLRFKSHASVLYWLGDGKREKRMAAMKARHHELEKPRRAARRSARPEVPFELYLQWLREGGRRRDVIRLARMAYEQAA